MARTYRNYVKCGACGGSNTKYYRSENRRVRHRNNHFLRNLMANFDIETVSDLIVTYKVIHDEWAEPTDGTCLIGRDDKHYYMNPDEKIWRTGESMPHYWNRMFGKQLKSKYYKH